MPVNYSTSGHEANTLPVSVCVIDQDRAHPVHARAESLEGRLVMAMSFGSKKGGFERFLARASCALAVDRAMKGMNVPKAFSDTCKEARKICRDNGRSESTSLLLASIQDGIFEAEWAGELSIVRIRNGSQDVLGGPRLWHMHQDGFTTRAPSFTKRRLEERDRLIVMSSNLDSSIRKKSYPCSDAPSTSPHECCAGLIHCALRERIDHAALIVADAWSGIL